LIWEERKARWRMRQLARKVTEKRKIKISKDGVWIEGEW